MTRFLSERDIKKKSNRTTSRLLRRNLLRPVTYDVLKLYQKCVLLMEDRPNQSKIHLLYLIHTDDLIGKEAKTLLKKLSSLLAEKWKKPYSVVCGYVNAQRSIAIVRATHLCLRGSRIHTSQMSNRRPQWKTRQDSLSSVTLSRLKN
jgi:hypothetical protein